MVYLHIITVDIDTWKEKNQSITSLTASYETFESCSEPVAGGAVSRGVNASTGQQTTANEEELHTWEGCP